MLKQKTESKKRGRPKGSKNAVIKEIGGPIVENTKRKNRPLQHDVVYRFKQGLTIPLGYYIDKVYTTKNRAETRIKNLKKMKPAKLAKELNITETQTKSLQFKIYSYRTPKNPNQAYTMVSKSTE